MASLYADIFVGFGTVIVTSTLYYYFPELSCFEFLTTQHNIIFLAFEQCINQLLDHRHFSLKLLLEELSNQRKFVKKRSRRKTP